MNAALAAVAAAFAIAWLVLSSAEPQVQALHLFHTFVPMTFALGIGGLWLAVNAARREGWTDRVEGVAVLSLLALAWGHDGGRAAVRRAAQLHGYADAILLETSPYRLASGVFMVASAALVVRWLTRREYGEWGWAAILLAWAAVVVLGQPYLQAALVAVYEALVAS